MISTTRTAWLACYLLTMKPNGLAIPLNVATACQKETVHRNLKSMLVKDSRYVIVTRNLINIGTLVYSAIASK